MLTLLIVKFKSAMIEHGASIVFVVCFSILSVSLLYQGYDKIKGFFGFDTVSTLKTKLATEKATTYNLIDANESLTTSTTIAHEVSTATVDIIVDNTATILATKAELIKLMAEKDAQIQQLIDLQRASMESSKVDPPVIETIVKTKVRTKVATKVSSGQSPPTVIEKKISTVQLTAIWSKYNSTQNKDLSHV